RAVELLERRTERPDDDSLLGASTNDEAANHGALAASHLRARRNVQRLRCRRGDLPHLAAISSDEVVEAAIRSDLQVDRGGKAGGESARRVIRRVHHPDPTTAQVGEEIFARITGREL